MKINYVKVSALRFISATKKMKIVIDDRSRLINKFFLYIVLAESNILLTQVAITARK